MSKLSLQQVKGRLAEAAKASDPFKNTQTVNLKTKTGGKAKEPSSKADKLKPLAKGVAGKKLKKMEVKKVTKAAGPGKAPPSGKMTDAKNGSAKPKSVAEPKMHVTGKKTTTPLANANGFSMDLSKLGVKWAKTREVSQWEKSDLEGTGIMSDKTKKVKFSVSMPKIDYGILPVDHTKMPSSQSPKFHPVGKVKLVKEGLVNGQVAIKLPNNIYNFDVMTASELKSICENYSSIGQEIEVVFKPLVRKFYLRPEIKKALAESVHYHTNNLKQSYSEKLSESKKVVKKALTESHSDFFASDKKKFVAETFAAVMKQGYFFYKSLYEAELKPYDVIVRAHTSTGRETFKIVTKALSEGHAAYNAFNEVLGVAGVSTKFDSAFVGAKKFIYEDVKGILTKAIKFDIDTKDFGKAKLGFRKANKIDPKAPKVGKINIKGKKPSGVDMMDKLSKGGDKSSARNEMGKDKRATTVKDYRPAAPKAK